MSCGVPSFKVILCGEYGVGKSAIFRRFVDNSFMTYQDVMSNIGLDHFAKKFTICKGCDVELVLWDTAGIERFATLSSSYFHSANVVIVCYALNNRESFSCTLQHILEAVEQTKTAKIFLCGTKKDIECADGITSEDVETLRDQLDIVLAGVFVVSNKTGEGISDMFEQIAQIMHRQVDERFDPSKIKISTEIECASSDPSVPAARRCC